LACDSIRTARERTAECVAGSDGQARPAACGLQRPSLPQVYTSRMDGRARVIWVGLVMCASAVCPPALAAGQQPLPPGTEMSRAETAALVRADLAKRL